MDGDTRRELWMLAEREPIPLARSVVLIAKEEYADLDIDKDLERLAELVREADPVVGRCTNTIERVQLLSEFLFERKGFAGNIENLGDPRNSFLNDVLERRLGLPITLSLVYIESARRLCLNLFGVAFPHHFLVKATDDRGELIIDAFNGGPTSAPAEQLCHA